MRNEVTYEEAMHWLDQRRQEAEYGDEEIIAYIEEMLWRYEDMNNS
jgi:hypothetical protein